MKKIITILATLMLTTMTINFAKAEGFGIGVTGSYTKISASGSETEAAGDTEKSTASVDNTAFIGSVYAEYSFKDVSWADANNGLTFGIQYTPGAADVSDKLKQRTDTVSKDTAASTSVTDTFKAQAEVENYLNYYVEIPLYKALYIKGGYSTIDVNTLENHATNDTKSHGTYGNKTLNGMNYGIGVKGMTSNNIVWKLAYEQTNFDELKLTSSTSNTLKADLDTSEVNLSIGYKF